MDEGLRRRNRDSDLTKGDAVALSKYLRERQLHGETAADLSGNLAEYAQDTRKAAFGLLEMSEGEQAVQEALILFSQQIDHARESAIQPREGDAPLPDRETILTSIQRTLTPEQARVFLDKKEVHEPTLVLVPITSTERYTEALQEASQTMEGSEEPSVLEFAQDQLNAQAIAAEVEENKIKKWKFAITEGAQTFDIPEWDNGQVTLQQRIDRFNSRYSSKQITRLDYPSYIALMHQGLRQGKPTDCKYQGDSKKRGAKNTWQYTLLNETGEGTIEEVTLGLVAAAHWGDYARHVILSGYNLESRVESARSRLAVMGLVI